MRVKRHIDLKAVQKISKAIAGRFEINTKTIPRKCNNASNHVYRGRDPVKYVLSLARPGWLDLVALGTLARPGCLDMTACDSTADMISKKYRLACRRCLPRSLCNVPSASDPHGSCLVYPFEYSDKAPRAVRESGAPTALRDAKTASEIA